MCSGFSAGEDGGVYMRSLPILPNCLSRYKMLSDCLPVYNFPQALLLWADQKLQVVQKPLVAVFAVGVLCI